jgi:predicted enzyme related to lactoylglutathione lyase
MAQVVHFEIHAEDPERASAFYTSVFGWEILRWNGPQEYWLITTGTSDTPGIDGAIMRRKAGKPKEGQPVNGFVNTVDVEDIEDAVGRVIENGGKVVVSKKPVSGVGWVVYCKDTEENIFSLMEQDPSVGTA